MDARELAGRFAAYTWYMEVRASRRPKREAARFARAHWQAFTPAVSEGLGRLLERVAACPIGNEMRRQVKRPTSCASADAGTSGSQTTAQKCARPITVAQA